MAKNDMILGAQGGASALIMPNKTVAKAPVKTPVAPKKVVSSAPVYKPSMPVSKPMNFSTPGLDLNGVITPKETLKPKINNISFQPFKLSPKIGEVSDITTGIDTTKGIDYGYGSRQNGTNKGKGFLGELKRPDGSISTEITINTSDVNGKDMEIPTLVPTLSQQEKQYLLSTPEDKVFEVNPKLMKQIQNKAVDFAKQRIAQGKDVFATPQDKTVTPFPVATKTATPQIRAQKFNIQPQFQSTIKEGTPGAKPKKTLLDIIHGGSPIIGPDTIKMVNDKIVEINTKARQDRTNPDIPYQDSVGAGIATVITTGLLGLKNSVSKISQGMGEVLAPGTSAQKVTGVANLAMGGFGAGMAIFTPALTTVFAGLEELPGTKQALDFVMNKGNDWIMNNTKNVPIWKDMDDQTKGEILGFARGLITFGILHKTTSEVVKLKGNIEAKGVVKTELNDAIKTLKPLEGETIKDAYLRQMKDIRAKDPTGKDPQVKLQEQNLNGAFKKITEAGMRDTITAMNKDPGMWEKIKEMRENIKPKSQKATTTTEIKPLSHFDNAKASVPTAPAIKVPEITHEESPVIEKDAMYQENDNSIEINGSKKSIIKKADARFGINNYEVEFLPNDGGSYHAVVTPNELKSNKFQEMTDEETQKATEYLRKSKGMSPNDIMSQFPDIQLKKDIPVTDIHGNKSIIDAGEALTPYELKGNKILLQDGETYIVSKNQYQNIKNQSVSGEAKEFAPELKGTEETILGSKLNKDEYAQKLNQGKKYDELTIDEKKLVDEVVRNKSTDNTKYSQYTLPGGENYKEVLIKAPENNKISDKELEEMETLARRMNNEIDFPKKDEERYNELKGKKVERFDTNFKSSHRSEPNVLAHLRLNERTYNGKKVTFMEELQSDRAREARKTAGDKEQYDSLKKELEWKQQSKDDLEIEKATLMKKIESSDNETINKEGLSDKWQSINFKLTQLADQINGIKSGMLAIKPTDSHPLLANRQEMAVKRALQEAVANGSEYFSWINGEQTANRYSLEKQLDKITRFDVTSAESPFKQIKVYVKGGSDIELQVAPDGNVLKSNKGELQGKSLGDVIGKGIAEQILKEKEGDLAGEGLKIGGERAYNLYDKQVAKIVENLTGKKPEKIDLGVQQEKEVVRDVISREKAEEAVKELQKKLPNKTFTIEPIQNGIFRIYERGGVGLVQQSIRLTPDVVARIKGESPLTKKPSGKQPFLQIEPSLLEQKFQEKSISKTITSDEAIKTAQERYPTIMKHLSVETVEKIFTPKGTEAFGSYKDRLIQLANNPKEFTMDHEIYHATLDLFKTKAEVSEILKEVQKTTGLTDSTKQEEWAARNFERYVKGKIPTKSSKLLQFFKDLWTKIKSVFKDKSVIDKFYDDILNKNKEWSPVEKGEGIQKYQSNMMAYDPISFDFIKRVAKIEAKEQRIGKVGNKKVGKEYKDQQMRQREKDKESLIEEIGEEYGLDTNEAYDKYDDFASRSYETINMTKSELNKKMKEQMEKYYGKEDYATHEEKNDAVQREVKKMIRARNKGKDVEEMKAYNSAMKALDKVDEKGKELSKDFYEKNKVTGKKKQGTRHSVTEFVSDALEPISYRLGRISRAIKTRVREFDFAEMYGTKKLIDESRPFLDKMKELRKDPEKFNEADLALKNGDIKKLSELGIEVPRGVLDALHDKALEHGIEVEYRKDYFPRVVENAKGLLDKLRGTDARGYVSDAIKERSKFMGRDLTLEEKADVANKLLSGYSVDGIRINMKNLKERTIDVITSELNQFYADPVDGYLNYISGMTRAIELKRLFGNEEADKAIGTFVAEMLENKQLKPKDEEELTKLLKVRFSPAITSKFVSALRGFISGTTMGSPISTLSQIQDLATSIYESGFGNILKKGGVDMTRDLGIEAISNEFSDQTVMQKTLEKIFTVTGFKAMDRLGKQTMVNSYFNKIKTQAKTDNPKLRTDLMEMFGNNEKRVNQIIADLKEGKLTEDGKFLLFNKVADYQPITQSEMPYGYLKAGNTRLLYVLKSFSLKQIESLRREGIDVMKDNFRKRKEYERDMKTGRIGEDEGKKKQKEAVKGGIQGAKNLLTLAGSLFILGATIDEVKDLIMMRKSSNILNLINDQPTDLGGRLIDNLLKLSGLSKYSIYQANNAGIGSAIQSVISMPTSTIDQIYRDMIMIFTNKNLDEWEKLKALETIQSVPLIGKLYYRWFGQPTMTSKHYDLKNPTGGLQTNEYTKDIFTGEIKPKKSTLSDIKPNKIQKIKKVDLSKIKPKKG